MKYEKKKILFFSEKQWPVNLFWTPEAQAKAEQSNFQFLIPARDGDVPGYDWGPDLKECDAILTTWGSPLCSGKLLEQAPKAKILAHCAGTVANVVDAGTYETGIRVTTANLVMAESVAEWSLLATLLVQRNLSAYAKLSPEQPMRWPEADHMGDIKQMTIGIWGFGDTTKHLLRMLAPLSPRRILVASEHASEEVLRQQGAEKADFDFLLKESDMIHCLVGANPANTGRFGPEEFAKMKSGAAIINGGRARLLQEEALLAALRSRKIRAVLDVFHTEPLPEDSPLNSLDNVILTPHNAGYPGRNRFLSFLLDELKCFFSGEPMRSEITRERAKSMTKSY